MIWWMALHFVGLSKTQGQPSDGGLAGRSFLRKPKSSPLHAGTTTTVDLGSAGQHIHVQYLPVLDQQHGMGTAQLHNTMQQSISQKRNPQRSLLLAIRFITWYGVLRTCSELARLLGQASRVCTTAARGTGRCGHYAGAEAPTMSLLHWAPSRYLSE